MDLNEPRQITFWIAVILAVVAVIAQFVAVVSPYAFWLLLIAFVVLAAGNLLKGV